MAEVVVPADVLSLYERCSLYNSPYVAHDRGCAIDLYPGSDGDGRNGTPGASTSAPSPVAGEVLDTVTVEAPPKPYAADHDHLVVVEVAAPASAAGRVARIMHVDPAVEPGDRVAIGDDLGDLVRAGFFAPWVDNHLHLGFRDPDANPYRASGSLPLGVGIDPEPLAWDGTGTVVEIGDTYALLDAPAHPAPGERWAGVAGTLDATSGTRTGVLDGGLPHYDGGGLLLRGSGSAEGGVSLTGHPVGTATGRNVTWDGLAVVADGRPITGISLFLARDGGFGAKLICPETSFEAGEDVTVTVERG